jgi:ribosome biogenesis GTPase / thiamine phosphate phosphatase
MALRNYGWDEYFESYYKDYLEKGYLPARVTFRQKSYYLLITENGEIGGKLSGKFRYNATMKKHFPVVGDWVIIQVASDKIQATICGLLPRKTCFVRKLAISGGRKIKNGIIVGGSTEEQVIASNIDIAFIVCGLDGNFNLERIERYITLVFNSGARPVIILNKMDCCNCVNDYIRKVENIARDIAIHPISVIKNQGMDIFKQYLLSGKTIVFLGSSGVGKSTITNYLLEEEKQKTNSTSNSTGKGRHTTTSAEMIFHISGCMIIDTPGLRELQLWCGEEAIGESFEDIVKVVLRCKYKDCKHDKEPGCAVIQAIADGVITSERLESYQKQYNELQRLNERINQSQKYLSKRAKLQAKMNQRGHK